MPPSLTSMNGDLVDDDAAMGSLFRSFVNGLFNDDADRFCDML